MGVEANSSTDITLHADIAHGQTVEGKIKQNLGGELEGLGGKIPYVFHSYKKGEALQNNYLVKRIIAVNYAEINH